MASTPIYSWPTPDNTDLVKNGALAIRTLGNAIDTTTATLVPKSLVDAKADLITATANDTPARLAVGNNGESLVVDSSTTTGLRWNPTYEAGKNFLINGGLDIWQRSTSASFGSFDPGFKTADRWYFFVSTANNTLSQETTTLPAGARFGLKWTSGGAGGTVAFQQVIETANTIPLAGKTVTLSAQVTGTTGKTASLRLFSSTGVDTTGISVSTLIATGSNVTLTDGTYSTVKLTVAVPSNVKTLKFVLRSDDTFANTEYMTFTNAQLEVGSVATSFTRAGSTIAGELALCQRYYYRVEPTGTATPFGNGFSDTTTVAHIFIPFENQMRIAPSALEQTGTAANYQVRRQGGGITACSAVPAIVGTNTNGAQITFTVASGLTAGEGLIARNAAANAYLAWSAEL